MRLKKTVTMWPAKDRHMQLAKLTEQIKMNTSRVFPSEQKKILLRATDIFLRKIYHIANNPDKYRFPIYMHFDHNPDGVGYKWKESRPVLITQVLADLYDYFTKAGFDCEITQEDYSTEENIYKMFYINGLKKK